MVEYEVWSSLCCLADVFTCFWTPMQGVLRKDSIIGNKQVAEGLWQFRDKNKQEWFFFQVFSGFEMQLSRLGHALLLSDFHNYVIKSRFGKVQTRQNAAWSRKWALVLWFNKMRGKVFCSFHWFYKVFFSFSRLYRQSEQSLSHGNFHVCGKQKEDMKLWLSWK